MASTTPNLGHPLMTANQGGAHVIYNTKAILDDILFGGIDGLTTATSPPGSPSNGDVVLVVATASGTFTGQEGTIAIYHDGNWSFYAIPSIWSTTEIATQLYRDGGQVYTKVVTLTLPTSVGSGLYASSSAHAITGIDLTKPVTIEGFFRAAGGTVVYYGSQVISPFTSSTYLSCTLSVDASAIQAISNFDMTGWVIRAKLLYCKT